jgi:hypothetical protein
MNCRKNYHKSFNGGLKTVKYQKYIVIHDTESGEVPDKVSAVFFFIMMKKGNTML